MVEIRDLKTGKLIKFEPLKNYLPNLPTFGRNLTSSMFSSSLSQKKNYLNQGHRIQKIKHDLSIYCQQLLILLDILYFQNMQLKQTDQAIKFKRDCQKFYRQFLNEQKKQLEAFEDKHRQSQIEYNSHSITKDEIGLNDIKNDSQGPELGLSRTAEPIEVK